MKGGFFEEKYDKGYFIGVSLKVDGCFLLPVGIHDAIHETVCEHDASPIIVPHLSTFIFIKYIFSYCIKIICNL